MAKGLVTGTHLTNIANAIRAKLGVQTIYQPSQMAAAIESIPTGGSNVLDLSTGIRFGYSQFTQLPDEIADADWSVVTSMNGIFSHCSNLTTIPLLGTSKITFAGLVNTFNNCSALSNASLNNILAMCANATLITDASYKTLKRVGLTSAQALICEDLSNWSAFLAAGWISGY